MASLSIVRPARAGGNGRAPAAEAFPSLAVAIRIDSAGVIQSVEGPGLLAGRSVPAGSDYFSLLEGICGGSPSRMAAVSAGIRAVGAGQADTFCLEFPCLLPDREMRMRLVATRYLQDGSAGVLLEHTDAEAQRDDLQSHKFEALGRLTGGVAHDFANLVTLIAGFSDILLNRIGAQDGSRPELEEIRKAAARGAGVAAQILDFLRKPAVLPGCVQLNTLVAETARLLRPIIGEHITLTVSLDPKLGVVRAEAAQMTRVIMNLVLNARDAMPRGGSIRIRTANVEPPEDAGHRLPPGRRVMLEISDTGAGMDQQTLRQIFRPFFTTKGGGTGLGLSTVQRIVEQAGGEIRAQSEPSRGSTFTICLPRAEREGPTGEPHDVARSPRHGSETILLAEDENSVRKLLSHLLAASGYRVLEAADGTAAWRVFEQHAGTIDLLLTDVIMPGMNGRELARQAQTCRPGLKVIYMSGYTDDVLSGAGALEADASFLRKPLKLDSLSVLIREVLDTPAIQ